VVLAELDQAHSLLGLLQLELDLVVLMLVVVEVVRLQEHLVLQPQAVVQVVGLQEPMLLHLQAVAVVVWAMVDQATLVATVAQVL
jgi:hypothetical protein